MADFNNPLSTQGYLALLASIVENNQAAVVQLEGVATLTNLPTNAKRWNATNNNWEKWSGSAWAALSTLYEIKVRDSDKLNNQTEAFYRNAGNLNAGTLPAARFDDSSHGNRGGGSLHGAVTTSVNGFMIAADKSKLDGIESGATGDQSASELLTSIKTVDGAGSGLDGDLLDGQHGAYYQNRVNHTGLQLMSTISNAGALATKSTVKQSDLSTALSDVGTATEAWLVQSSGYYGFYPNIALTGGAGTMDVNIGMQSAPGTSDVSHIYLKAVTNNRIAHSHQRYIQASPPYDLGDGQIFNFSFVLMDKVTGEPIASSSAPDPVWANNGPTILNPLGRLQAYVQSKLPGDFKTASDNPVMFSQYLGQLRKAKTLSGEEIFTIMNTEPTPAEKNADMDLIPHPFLDYDPAKHVVVMLDPVGLFNEDLHSIHEWSGDHLSEIILGKYLVIDNVAIENCNCPRDVMPVKARFK